LGIGAFFMAEVTEPEFVALAHVVEYIEEEHAHD